MQKPKGKYLSHDDSDRFSVEPLRDSTPFSTSNRLQEEPQQLKHFFEKDKENRLDNTTTGPASIEAVGAGTQEPGTGLVEQSQHIPTKSTELAQQLFPDSSIGSNSPNTSTSVHRPAPAGSLRPQKRATPSTPSSSYGRNLELNSSISEGGLRTLSQRSHHSERSSEGTTSQRTQFSQRSNPGTRSTQVNFGNPLVENLEKFPMSAPAPNQQRHMRACMVCSVVKTTQDFKRAGCPNCEHFLELAGNDDQIQDCTSQVFEGLIAVTDTSGKSWVVRHQRLEGYVPGVYATQVEGVLPEDVAVAAENAGVHYIPRDGSSNEVIADDQ
jgi:transcription elongation factor SPT4